MAEPRQVIAAQQEEQFLRLCLRGRWDSAALEAARTLASQADVQWHGLYQLALTERLAPLLYTVVRDRHWAPPAVEEALRRAYRGTVLRNTFLFQQLEDVLHALAARGVEVILLKGASLCKTVYGRAGVRPMGDLDLLVRKEDVATALRALGPLGWEPVRLETHAGAAPVYENEAILSKTGLIKTLVEVHWSLFDSPHHQQRLPMDWFWQTALPTDVGDARAWVLAPEAQLLHLCGHLFLHHAGIGLLWRYDVAEMIGFYGSRIDWEELLNWARACDLVFPVQRTLTQVVEEWGAFVPGDVLARLQALPMSRAEARVFARLTSKDRPVAQRFWADLASLPDWSARLGYAWISLFPSSAYMRRRYRIRRPILLPLYYLYRWARGVGSAIPLGCSAGRAAQVDDHRS